MIDEGLEIGVNNDLGFIKQRQYGTSVRYGTLRYGTVKYCTVWYGTVRYRFGTVGTYRTVR